MPNKDKKPSEEELKWDKLLSKLGIQIPDKYEEILYGFLESGLVEIDSLKAQFSKYKYENKGQEIYIQIKDFFTNVYWNHKITEDELLSMAEVFLPLAGELGYNTISSIISTVEELGNQVLANRFLDIWLKAVDDREGLSHLEAMTIGNKCHPRIKEKLKELENKHNPPLSLVESVERIRETASWGDREKSAFGNSTIQQYEDTLREINNDTLRRFIQIHIEWIRKPYDEAFKKGVDNFVAACTKIYSDESTSRLSKIIYRAFESEQLTEKLICS